MAKPEISKKLIKHVFEMKFEDLPSAVIDQTKNCILDFLGTATAGSSTELGELVKAYSNSFSSSGEATVLTTGRKASVQEAALVNGMVGHVLELDDGNRYAMGHPGVVTIPAALAAAEQVRADGKRFIMGVVCGYEVFGRLGKALNPSHFNRGFHTTGTLGTMAAAVAASKVLSLTEDQTLNAFGIAGSLAAGISEYLSDGSMTKQIHAGRAAMNGVFASQLALRGFSGPHTVLEGDHGFAKAFSDNTCVEKIVENLSASYEIMNTYFKRHASCRHSHPAVDATLELLTKEKIYPDKVDEISVRTYSAAYDYTNIRTVTTPLSAKMSMFYCVAVTLLRGRAGPQEFTEQTIEDEKIGQLMDKVKMSVDEELDALVPNKRGAVVTISMGHERFCSRVDLPKGEPENPLSRMEFEEKFRALASRSFTEQGLKDILERLSKLESTRDMNDFTELLSSTC